jgi:hypothetical protein
VTYRDDLEAARSLAETRERELVAAEKERARLADELARTRSSHESAVTLVEKLRAQNVKLERERYALPRGRVVRLVVGLAIAALGASDVVASWGTADRMPPALGLEAGPAAAIAAVVAAIVIGGAPFLAVSVLVLAATSALLISKPWIAPIFSSWSGGAFGTTSETHLYFVYSGVGLLVVIGLIIYAVLVNRKPARR